LERVLMARFRLSDWPFFQPSSSEKVLVFEPAMAFAYPFEVKTSFPVYGKAETVALGGQMLHAYLAYLRRIEPKGGKPRLQPYIKGKVFRFWDKESQNLLEIHQRRVNWSVQRGLALARLSAASSYSGGGPGLRG